MPIQKSSAQAAGFRPDFADRSSLRSTLSANRSKNSFATATDLGVFRGGSGSYRFSGTLSKKDPVGFYKYTFAQGASITKGLDKLRVLSGGLRVTGFFDDGTGLTKVGQSVYSKGTYRQVVQGFTVPSDFTVHIRYDRHIRYNRPKGTTRYQASSLFF